MALKLKGLSEYVSALLMAVIVLALGGLVIMGLYSWYTSLVSTLTMEKARYSVELSQALAAPIALINSSNYIVVVLATGPNPVKLEGIYVNDTPAHEVYITGGGETIQFTGQPVELEPFRAYIVAINGSSYGSQLGPTRVKIVYEGGFIEVVASPPS